MTTDTNELLDLAAERVTLPESEMWLDYQEDADLLYVKLKEHPRPNHTKSDYANGVIYNYEGSQLVSIEILDLYGVFISQSPHPAA